MEKRIGVIGIVVEEREKVNQELNNILSDYASLIIGRMGVPKKEWGIGIISLIVEGTSDDLGALTGKLGNLPGITLKSALTSKIVNSY